MDHPKKLISALYPTALSYCFSGHLPRMRRLSPVSEAHVLSDQRGTQYGCIPIMPVGASPTLIELGRVRTGWKQPPLKSGITGRSNLHIQGTIQYTISSYVPRGTALPRPAYPILNTLPSPNAEASEGRVGWRWPPDTLARPGGPNLGKGGSWSSAALSYTSFSG